MDGLDFQISEKPLSTLFPNGIIEECHRRLVNNESILLVTQKFGFSRDTEATAREIFNRLLKVTVGKLPEVPSVRVFVENHGCGPLLDKNGNMKLVPDWMEEIDNFPIKKTLDVTMLQIMVYVIEKPASWEKFDRAIPFSERDDIKVYVNPDEPADNTANWFVSKLQEHENFLQSKERDVINITTKEIKVNNPP